MKSGVALALTVFLYLPQQVYAGESPQFRGPNRDGHFQETNLLKSWPESGPELLWAVNGLGQGYASVAVANGKIFTTGMSNYEGYLFAYTLDGRLEWKRLYGEEHHGGGYPGARSTPTIDGENIYIISSMGVVYCYKAASGDLVWKVDTLQRFKGMKRKDELIPRWSISESLLIDGNKVICTPGAPDAGVVALNKNNGETVWRSKGLSDLSGYCSPRIFDNGKIRRIVTMTANALVIIHPEDGKLLARKVYEGSWDIHANTPVFNGNDIYVSDGYGRGGAMFTLNEVGDKLTLKWKESSLDIHHGGAVMLDGSIYGASNRGHWIRLDAQSGRVTGKGRGVGKGAIVYADGLLYGYGENGRVGIVDPKGDLMAISKFRIRKGTGQHWAHPVLSSGVLYIRHGDVLLAYNVSAE